MNKTEKEKNKLHKGKIKLSYVNKQNIIRLIVFTAIFSFAFINIYKPFNFEEWVDRYSPVGYFMMSFILVLTGIFVLIISRTVMYQFVKRHSLYYIEYFIWVIMEILVVAGFYTAYVIYLRDDLAFWSWSDVVMVFKEAGINTCMVVLLPYSVSWLFFSYEEARKSLRELQGSVLNNDKQIIQFKDEKDELRFSIPCVNVVFLEASNNYVEINYIRNGKVVQHILRTSLKKLTKELESTSIRRCHRSYMVNFEHVTALRKTSKGEIDMEMNITDAKKIPVSKSYADEITEAFLAFGGAEGNVVKA